MNIVESPAVVDAPRSPIMLPDTSWTEAELIAGCRAGRRDALDTLVARHYDRLYRLAWSMAGPESAADLTQETFLAAVKSIPNFRGDAQLGTWLVSILRNQFSLHLRGQRKWKLSSIDGEGDRLPAPEPPEIERSVREILDRVKELPEELRTTLVLFYVDGMKYADIAAAMECPIGTVRSRLFEARERLKKLVSKAGAP